MAKTKMSIAERRTDLHAPPPGGDPPSKRHKGKSAAKVVVKDEQPDLPTGRCNFELTWENIGKVMSFYKLSEKDATKLLLEVVGPDPKGSNFWSTYAHRIKQERLEAAQQEALEESQRAARAAGSMLQPILPENQEGDETLFPPHVPPTDFDEGEEEEFDGEDDPEIDDRDMIGVPANGGKGDGDDQDSPASGVAVTQEPKVKVCTGQPEEHLEPVRTPVEIHQAAKDAGDEFSRRVRQVPTPMTESTVARAGVSSPPELKSMLFFDSISTCFLYVSLFPLQLVFSYILYIYIYPLKYSTTEVVQYFGAWAGNIEQTSIWGSARQRQRIRS